MIERKIHQNIQKLLSAFPAVAILGPRQVGKTTLAKNLFLPQLKEVVYLDMERFEDAIKLTNPALFLEPLKDVLVIIDEIQRKPELFPELRSLIDKHRIPARFLLLGSATPDLMRQSSETLAGRIAYVELTPFHIGELPEADKNNLWLKGGFPDAFFSSDAFIWNNWQNSFITTYVERDLPGFGLNATPIQLRTFINMLAGMQGNMINMNTISRSMGISVQTVCKYLDYFENAYLIRRLAPFHVNSKKRLIKTPKLYIRDIGLYHYLTGISVQQQLLGSINLGASWESFVIIQIVSNIDHQTEAWFYRTQDGTECDLLLTRAGKPIASVEAKISAQPSRTKSFTLAVNDLGTKNNFIIIPECTKSYQIAYDTRVIGIFEFVNQILPEL